MLRSVIAVVVGVVIGVAVVALFEPVAHRLIVTNESVAASLAVPAVWFAASFIGGLAASLIARRWAPAVIVVAASLLLLAAANSTLFPYSVWMIAGSLVATILGGAAAIKATAARFGRASTPAKTDPI